MAFPRAGLVRQLQLSRASAAWRAALSGWGSSRALSLQGGRQGDPRGKATPTQSSHNTAAGTRSVAGAGAVAENRGGKRESLASIVGLVVSSGSASVGGQRVGGEVPHKMRNGSSDTGIAEETRSRRHPERVRSVRGELGAALAGPFRGSVRLRERSQVGNIYGKHVVPVHLTQLWGWARERARVNSKVKMDWLSEEKSLTGALKTDQLHPPNTVTVKPKEHPDRVNSTKQVEALGTTHYGAQPSRMQLTDVAQTQTYTEQMEKVPQLTREFWDKLLLQRDPTKGLRDVALRSLMYEESGGGTHDKPVDATLWWMESQLRIKWGGGGYLPENLRRGEEIAPVQGEKVLINHVIQVVAQAPCRLRVRWAALLHDVGKPATVAMHDGKLTFTAHEREGALMVKRILCAYGYDDKFCKEVATLVLRSGRIRMVEKFNDQGARRLLATMGPLFEDLLDLYAADCTSAKAHKQAEHQARANLLSQHVQAVLDRDRLTSLRSPLNGHDIMKATGLRPGMHLGRLVRALREDYLKRGPYSAAEAYEVVERLHSQLASSGLKDSPFQGRWRKRVRRADMETPSEIWGDHTDDTNWKPLISSPGAEKSQDEREEVLVFRLRLDCQRSCVAHNGAHGATTTEFEHGEVFRDVAVRRDTSLYTLAKIVTHAFDFDFDDDFAFYRRRRGLECPGAEAAYSGIPASARRIEETPITPPPETLSTASHTYIEGLDTAESSVLHKEPVLGHDFELLARASGSSLRFVNPGGFAFRYDKQEALPGSSKSCLEWCPHDDDDHFLDGMFAQISCKFIWMLVCLCFPCRARARGGEGATRYCSSLGLTRPQYLKTYPEHTQKRPQ